jgi:Glutaredoxin-like domain (DUF836)
MLLCVRFCCNIGQSQKKNYSLGCSAVVRIPLNLREHSSSLITRRVLLIDIIMRLTTRLLHACRITFFTRSNCSLCDNAKLVLSKVWDKQPFDYVEVPVMEAAHKKWQIYQFDTPVVCRIKPRHGYFTTNMLIQ